jgi:GNAT superfamily N-acetyltransferase
MGSNKSNAVIVGFKQVIAQPSDLDTVRMIVETTINQIYPLYYPRDVVQFFLEYHAPDRILIDIDAGNVYLFLIDSAIVVGTGTIYGNEIKRVFVLPEYQGRGYGSVIMQQLEGIVFRTYRTVKLDSSLPAFGMYLKRGYKPHAWRRVVTPGGQVLCYHEMEKENLQALHDS